MSPTTVLWRLTGLAATSMALTACDGGEPVLPDTSPQFQSAQFLADDPLPENGATSTTDLTITALTHEQTTDGGHRFQITVASTDKSVDVGNLSFMMETATTDSFQSVYKSALYDQHVITQDIGQATITARTKDVPLRNAVFYTRIVVNPDWHQYLETALVNNDLSTPLHYIEDSNYQNNASATINTTVSNDYSCTEDSHENNDTFVQATALPTGANLNASLCDDNADYYALGINSGETTVVSFDYTNASLTDWTTRYSIINSQYQRVESGVLDTATQDIRITADTSGTHYLAIYGERNEYRLSRDTSTALPPDWFFSTDTVDGPVSQVYGPIGLTRLAFNEIDLTDHTIRCSRFVIDPITGDNYITPSHFPQTHDFVFLANNELIIDRTRQDLWNASTGDITSDSWYTNPYFGWAENTGEGSFRYWEFDGSSYIGCHAK